MMIFVIEKKSQTMALFVEILAHGRHALLMRIRNPDSVSLARNSQLACRTDKDKSLWRLDPLLSHLLTTGKKDLVVKTNWNTTFHHGSAQTHFQQVPGHSSTFETLWPCI